MGGRSSHDLARMPVRRAIAAQLSGGCDLRAVRNAGIEMGR